MVPGAEAKISCLLLWSVAAALQGQGTRIGLGRALESYLVVVVVGFGSNFMVLSIVQVDLSATKMLEFLKVSKV